jgi:hypothetical protein
MRRTALASLVILAGCAGTAQNVVDGGHRYDFGSAVPPRALAACAVQNARSFSSAYTADYLEMTRPGHYQAVVMRTGGLRAYEPIIVALTSPTAYGGQMAVYVHGGLGAAAEADWIERLRRGCVDVSAPVVPAVPHNVPASRPPG